MRAPTLPDAARLLAACAGHAFLLWLALTQFRFAPSWHTVIWPPHAWVFSLFLLVPLAHWRWLALGLVLTETVTHHLIIGTPWSGGLTFSLINLVQAGLPAYVLKHLGYRPFQHLRDLILFLVLVLVAVSPWTSLAGCYNNTYFFGTSCDMGIAVRWWITNAVSLITLAPAMVLLAGLQHSPERSRWQEHGIEAATLLLTTWLLALWIFQRPPDSNPLLVSLAYLSIPVLIWAALRVGPALTALGTLMVTAISIQATHDGMGPFASTGISTDIAILNLQTFLGMMAGCSLLVSVLAEDLRRTERLSALKERNMELEGLLRHGSRQIHSHLSNIGRQAMALQQHADSAPETITALITLQDHRQRALKLLAALTQYVGIGEKQAQQQPVDMMQMLNALRDEYAEELSQFSAQLELNELPSCMGDPEQLHEIFSQLLDTAIRHRAPDVTLRIQIKAERYETHITYIVEDNGRGIDAEAQKVLLQPFHPGGASLENGDIGLATARRLTELNQGTMRLASAPGLGSRFYVTLPRVTPP